MSDRYAPMSWPFAGPCPTCGLSADGVAVYRPTHGVPVSDEARAAHLAFADKRRPDGGVEK